MGRHWPELRDHRGSVRGRWSGRDGRLLSWSGDGTLRLWTADGAPLVVTHGALGRGGGSARAQNGRLLSWSDDWALRLWLLMGAAG